MKVLVLAAAMALAQEAAFATTDRDARLTQELDRLEATLIRVEKAGLPKEFGDRLPAQRELIARARAARRPVLRLYRLREPFIGIETLAFFAAHKDAAADLVALQALWRSRKQRFGNAAPRAGASLLLNALEEGARNRAGRFARASIPYAKVTTPAAGLYYLAEAEANLRFAEFARSLRWPAAHEPRPKLEALASALEALDAETLAFFADDPTSRRAIAVSARLKEARELLDQRLLEGAALALLEARLDLSRRKADPAAAVTMPPGIPTGKAAESLRELWLAMIAEDEAARALVRQAVLPLHDTLFRSRP